MYINDGYSITNTPLTSAAYNTYPYTTKNIYQKIPMSYTSADGYTYEAFQWGQGCYLILPGGTYCGTPTRSAGYYQQNYMQIPCDQCQYKNDPM